MDKKVPTTPASAPPSTTGTPPAATGAPLATIEPLSKDSKNIVYFYGQYPIIMSEGETEFPEESKIGLRTMGHLNVSHITITTDAFSRLCLEVEERKDGKIDMYKYLLVKFK